ncbi:MAG: type II secretion system F family protein [Planctomycetes bacterium]|nr:type II secretion system F family protein [Planctomycetota bacterium]MCH9723450.1 type II secretion system F family protein [Planctomycetota bacterium]MCH9775180.1 type II secretion system F family protein [Planctomycetota bacterium]
MFQARASLKSLALLCRSLSTMLESGVSITKSFELAAKKMGDYRLQQTLREIIVELKSGNDVTSAMRKQGTFFPELLVNMVSVAEQSGGLPEVLKALAEHYDHLLNMRKNFFRLIAWPVFQFVIAILVIALMILVLGLIASAQGGQAIDVLGLGLSGPSGAMIWLTCTFGSIIVLFVAYQILDRMFGGKRYFHRMFLKIPVLGGCMRSFAMARFSWAFALTQQAGMNILDSLDASLKATGNGAFIAEIPRVNSVINDGEHLTNALADTGLFTEEYIHMVDVGETSGTVPETLQRLSPRFQEDAQRSLATLAAVMGWLIWALVAAFIIFVVFRIAFWYLGIINDALQQV